MARSIGAAAAAAALIAASGCAADREPVALPIASITPGPTASAAPSATFAPRPADAPVTVDEVAAIALSLPGLAWRAEIAVSTAAAAHERIRSTRAGHTSPARCVDLLLGAELATAADRERNPSGADAIVTLGRAALDGDPAPEAVRVRVLADVESAQTLAAAIRGSAERCNGYEYVPDTHYREVVKKVAVSDAIVGGSAATVVTWSNRTQLVDGERLTRVRGAYLAGYLIVVRNLVVWIEYDVAAGAPNPEHVGAALAAVRDGLE